MQESTYDAITFATEDRLACINRHTLDVWALERTAGVAAAAGSNQRALPPLLAATSSGRLLRLRAGSRVVERAIDIQVGADKEKCCWLILAMPTAAL
jgi:hypothetical protein